MKNRIKIVVDNKIPMIKGVLEPYAEVFYSNPFDFTKELVKDKDALIIRTRTKCNAGLLEGSSVKFIATATIGYDHIDTKYCESNNIKWMNAPGCNSSSVMQYIASALVTIAKKKKLRFADTTLGVVGVGNVGSKVAKTAKLLGMKVLLNDPPRMRSEGIEGFTKLDDIISESDIITFHVPLIKEGIDKTFHMADDIFFNKLNREKIIFNSSRGPVVETIALKNAIKKRIVTASLLDVWEKEPDIDSELLKLVDIATPHIAGYSADGKANGTAACVQGASEFFDLGIEKNWYPAEIPNPLNSKQITIDCKDINLQQILSEAVLSTYDITNDDKTLRNSIVTFEKQRGSYPVRREFPFYEVKLLNGNTEIEKRISDLGFKLIN
jgi:erythronate-4-phosphate dehydrogenase